VAFYETDIRTIVEKALSFIDSDSKMALCVRIVLEEHAKKTPYREVRNMLVEATKDLGWFQAPANVGFMLIGLLYGEGDFKKSLVYAINCGDDTDCTAATCGATLGIIYGAEAIPAELKEHVGDRIVTISINGSYNYKVPRTCTDLTDRVIKLIPSVLYANDVYMEYTEGETEYNKEEAFGLLAGSTQRFLGRKPHSFEVTSGYHWNAVIEYDKDPVIAPGETFEIRATFSHKYRQSLRANLEVSVPEGWSVRYNKSIYVGETNQLADRTTTTRILVTAGEVVDVTNEVTIKLISHLSPMPMYIPAVLLGKEFEDIYTVYGSGTVAPVHDSV